MAKEWSSSYNCHSLRLAKDFTLACNWDSLSPREQAGGFVCYVNRVRLSEKKNDLDEAKAYTIQNAKAYVGEILAALETL